MVKLVIDNQEIEVEAGTSILKACEALKKDHETKEFFYVGNPDNLEFEIAKKHGYNFLEIVSDPVYDFIIASPPFSNNSDVLHITKMFEFLKIGGRIITTASNSGSNNLDIFLNNIKDISKIKKIILPKNSFGENSNNVNSILLIIDKI